jgi:hypothetical protein
MMKEIKSKNNEEVYIKDKSICPECSEKMYDRKDAYVCFKCMVEIKNDILPYPKG